MSVESVGVNVSLFFGGEVKVREHGWLEADPFFDEAFVPNEEVIEVQIRLSDQVIGRERRSRIRVYSVIALKLRIQLDRTIGTPLRDIIR
jgi:hypothetical protein